jgi:MbtH protein
MEEDWLMSEMADDRNYSVVVNDEEQYSIWLSGRQLPAGWRIEGTQGSKEACLEHINKVWTDMRPLSLRRAMAADEELAGRPAGRQ